MPRFVKFILCYLVIMSVTIGIFRYQSDGSQQVPFKDGSYFKIQTAVSWCPQDDTLIGSITSSILSYKDRYQSGQRVITKGACDVIKVSPANPAKPEQLFLNAEPLDPTGFCSNTEKYESPITMPGGTVFYCEGESKEAPSGRIFMFIYPAGIKKMMMATVDSVVFAENQAAILEMLKSVTYHEK